jgi:carboxyl-terminal processing protease
MPRAGCLSARTVIGCVFLSATISVVHALEPVAATYLDEAIVAIERNFYRSSEVDWEAQRATARAQAQGARQPEDTYAAIVDTLIRLDSHANFFGGPVAVGAATPVGMGVQFGRTDGRFQVASVNPGSAAEEAGLAIGDIMIEVDGQPFHPARVLGLATNVTQVVVVVERPGVSDPLVFEVPRRPSTPANAPPTGALLDGDIGYVALPGHNGTGLVGDGRDYAGVVQELLAELDGAGACGWVVDLRLNSGGNAGPMLAGIAPLLGVGAVGGFDRNGTLNEWRYQPATGAFQVGGFTMGRSPTTHSVRDQEAPVAVLTGPATISAGEFVVIAFRGRAATRSFGAPTGGLSTWLDGTRLSDGAVMIVSNGATADRTGERHDGPIEPDVLVDAGAATNDATLAAALEWLRERQPCAN